MTQQTVAANASMDRSYLSDVERGQAVASLESFLKICRAMRVSAAMVIAMVEADR